MRRIGVLCAVVFAMTFLVRAVWAQEAMLSPAPSDPWSMLMEMALKSMIPAIWVAVGPLAVAAITKGVNGLAGAYVPRSVQVILSGLVTAVAAGLAGDASGVAQAVGTGMGSQMLAATRPETLLTSARDPVAPDSLRASMSGTVPMLMICGLLSLTACKSGDGAKFSQKLIRLSGDVQRVLVEGCDGLPGITVAYQTLAPLIPVNSDLAKGFEIGQDHAEKVCAKVTPAKVAPAS